MGAAESNEHQSRSRTKTVMLTFCATRPTISFGQQQHLSHVWLASTALSARAYALSTYEVAAVVVFVTLLGRFTTPLSTLSRSSCWHGKDTSVSLWHGVTWPSRSCLCITANRFDIFRYRSLFLTLSFKPRIGTLFCLPRLLFCFCSLHFFRFFAAVRRPTRCVYALRTRHHLLF